MKLLYQILRAVHANGTHHKLALDALVHMSAKNEQDWQRLFLSHAAIYMEGAKAPDKEFKDFKNHVLHVRDNLWGGAPAKARSWYGHLVDALKARDWELAAYSAGVLSHYYTDPIMPLHTAQSEAESNVHRAIEWSVSKSYDQLVADALPKFDHHIIPVSDDPNWLAEMVVAGATKSNQHYERLITHYNIDQGVVDPLAGLDKVAQKTIGGLLVYAACGFALILDRAIGEAAVTPPKVRLTAKTVLAALNIPIYWVTNKTANKQEAQLIRAMYDELQETGTVEVNLPEDDRMIRDLYQAEVANAAPCIKTDQRFPMPPPISKDRKKRRKKAKRLPNNPNVKASTNTRIPVASKTKQASSTPTAPITAAIIKPPTSTPGSGLTQKIAAVQTAPSTSGPAPALAAAAAKSRADKANTIPSGGSLTQSLSRLTRRDQTDKTATQAMDQSRATAPADNQATPTLAFPSVPTIGSARKGKTRVPRQSHAAQNGERFYLSIGDDIVDAPSIGKKTATRLNEAGLYSVEDLLTCDPESVTNQLAIRHITPEALIDWQDQARLVCTVPELRGTHAQILVGAGYRDPETIAASDQTALLADILRYSQSPDGQRVLRSGQPPALDKVLSWIAQAGRADVARAA